MKKFLISFLILIVLIFNCIPIGSALATPKRSSLNNFCRAQTPLELSFNSGGRFRVQRAFPVFIPKQNLKPEGRSLKPMTMPNALPMGKDPQYYKPVIMGKCNLQESQYLFYPAIYAVEFPTRDGKILVKIGETECPARRFAQIRDELRLRSPRSKFMLEAFDQLQKDFPEEKSWDGYVYPRFVILQVGSDLEKLSERIRWENHHINDILADPDKILLNPFNDKKK